MTMAERLCCEPVTVLHGRRIPGCPARIDHLAIGPGGLTVIGAGPVRGRDPFALRDLVTAVERHVDLLRACLRQWNAADVDVRGCLCPADLHGVEDRSRACASATSRCSAPRAPRAWPPARARSPPPAWSAWPASPPRRFRRP